MDRILGQVTTCEWAITPADGITPTARHGRAADEITEFLDGGFNSNPTTFDKLCREWLNDILTIDAGVLELVPDESGWISEIYARDGATFTKSPDKFGRLPSPGDDTPAYYQVGMQAGMWSHQTQTDILPGTSWRGAYQAITPVPFSRDQLVWVEENPRTYSVYGWSRVQKVQRLVEILLNQDSSNLQYFPANEIPEGALNLVESSQDEIERFREYWSDEIAGKPHKLPILNAKNLQWIPFRASPRELEFLQSQEWYNNLVWMTFGLSSGEVGYVQDVNRSTMQEQTEAVWRQTTLPLLELLRNAINRCILPYLEQYWDVGGELQFVWDPHNPLMDRIRRDEERTDLRLGLTTPNRILAAGGDDPVPWGDMPLVLFESLCRTQPEWIASEIVGLDNVPEPAFGGGLYLGAPAPEIEKRPTAEEEPPEWRSRIAALHRQVSATIRSELDPLIAELEAEYPGTDDETPALDIEGIVSRIDLTDALLSATDDARADAMQRGADLEEQQLEGELSKRAGGLVVKLVYPDGAKRFNIRDTFAFRQLREMAAINMRNTTQTIRDRVRDTLVRIVGSGGNVTDAWLALRETVDSLSENHARLVARTEIMSSSRRGSQALAEAVPDLVGGKKWMSRKINGRTRPWHAAMHGVIVGVDESFEVPQLGVRGQPREYPRQALVVGDDQPFNCMCSQRLVLRDDLPADADGLRSIRCLSISSPPSTRQQEILDTHGDPGETIRDLLIRHERTMSKNQTADALGISKATLYEWRKQEGL
jgi:hypothetical protein